MFKNLSEVRDWISHNYDDRKDIMEQIKTILEPLSGKKQVIKLLTSLLKDDIWLEEIAQRSYTHINGFDKLVLIESKEPEYKLRLHIWWPEHFVNHIEHIHNHPWHFSSRILTGNLRFQTFRETSATEIAPLYHHQTFPPIPGDSGHIIKRIGTKKLDIDFDGTISAGSFYTMHKDIMHRVIKIKEETNSTLLLQGPFGEGISNLFTDQDYVSPEKTTLKFFDKNIVKNKIERYINVLMQHN
ncbi:hypothetical protein AB9M62_47610 [Bacillales bacterium AN1005]